jgi:hypothetical protein
LKCIHCQHDSKYQERSDRRCPKCRHLFAFEPKQQDPLTDPAFQAAIDRVSAGGKLRFGPDNLRYELLRRQLRRYKPRAIAASVFSAIGLLGLTGVGFLPALGLLPGAVGLVLLYRRLRRVPPSPQHPLDFDRLWHRWRQVHGAPTTLIVPRPARPFREPGPDVGNYSFDRAVICDRQETVDLLLANNFHFENNCAVLSIHGYPPGAFEVVLAMLKRNPRLRVFALHDASLEGCTMAHLLVTQPAWFPGFTVIDVGLRPGHAGPFLGLYRESTQQVLAQPGVAAEEAAWLSRYTLELAVIRPEQVLKRLYRAIHRQDQEDARRDARGQAASGADGGDFYIGRRGTYVTDESSFASDAGAADGGADSFG